MPIDAAKALAHEFEDSKASWGQDDIILYNLGIGAGRDPMDLEELKYVYENGLKTIPSFGVIPVFAAMGGLIGIEGVDINPMMILHGEQDLVLHQPIPTQAEVINTPKVTGIYDKGKGALINFECATRDANSGEALFTNTFGIFVRGEGGFGGESGPAPGNVAPDRDPDRVVESATEPWQALLYRLSGDKNPLHADPNMASAVGFPQPILHGLCTFGVVCKAVIDSALDGDPNAVARYQVRFSKPVLPGQTIVVKQWDDGDTIIIEASVKETGDKVLSNAAITRR